MATPGLNAQQQNASSSNSPALTVTVPAAMNGTNPPLLPANSSVSENEIVGGLAVGAVYDDNIDSARHAGYLYTISPDIMFQQTRPRTSWDLRYLGGLTLSQQDPAASNVTQNATTATAEVRRLLAPHTLLALRQDFSMTNNPFGQADQGPTLASISGIGQLNSAAGLPVATRISFVSSGSLTHQFSQHASIGAAGSFSTLRFRNLPKLSGISVDLIDSRTSSGRVFYVTDISPHQRIGVEYQVQDLRFDNDSARTVDQALFLFDEVNLNARVSLTLFAGPDVTHTHNNIVAPSLGGAPSVLHALSNVWTPAGGATCTWVGQHFALRITGSSMVTDGGGTTGAIRAMTTTAELRRDFMNRWSVTPAFTFSDGRLIEDPAAAATSRITTEQAGLGVAHQLSQRISLRAQYAHVQQLSAGSATPYNTGNHNRTSMSILYQFASPLGR